MGHAIAITRPIASSFARCELTHVAREPIDVDAARRQHAAYEAALEAAGCRLERLPLADDQPDSVFVEDTAVVVDEVAVITRPGAVSRRRELAPIEDRLSRYRRIRRIEAPGTLDGGDVLRIGRRLFVGRSSRTNGAGTSRLGELLGPYDYEVIPVDIDGCLHLKTAITRVGPDTLLVQPAWVDTLPFRDLRLVEVDPEEPSAANALWLGEDRVLLSSAFPGTARRLAERDLEVLSIDVSEIARAEGGVTCCSVLLRDLGPREERADPRDLSGPNRTETEIEGG